MTTSRITYHVSCIVTEAKEEQNPPITHFACIHNTNNKYGSKEKEEETKIAFFTLSFI